MRLACQDFPEARVTLALLVRKALRVRLVCQDFLETPVTLALLDLRVFRAFLDLPVSTAYRPRR